MKTSAAIDFVNTLRPRRAFPVHHAQLNDRGLRSVNGRLAEETDSGYRYLRPREALNVD